MEQIELSHLPLKRKHQVLRGRVSRLEGNQTFPLISWLRFELDGLEVLLHQTMLLPPNLKEGDEVIIAGKPRQGKVDALAIRRVDETVTAWQDRTRQQRRRQRAWFSIALAIPVVCVLATWLLGGLEALGQNSWSLLVCLVPAFQFSTLASYLREAELELIVAADRGEVETPPHGFP